MTFDKTKKSIESPQMHIKNQSILEDFKRSIDDLKKIDIVINNDNFNCRKPLNMYEVFFWSLILIILIYLLFEYLYKKSK